eukprot:jgi/Tetstr1/421922/TSEL_012822.t1
MRRPEGTDGSDHEYRQVIHNRYKNRATLKKRIALLTHLVIPAHALRALWHCTPIFLGVGDCTTGTYYVFALAFMSSLLQTAGLNAKPQPSYRVLMVSSIAMMLAVVGDGMLFWAYFTMAPKHLLYPELIANQMMLKRGLSYGTVKSIASTVEAFVTAASLLVTLPCVKFTHTFVMDISGKSERMGGTRWNPKQVLGDVDEPAPALQGAQKKDE